jgi:drug/metabolite transporter (DMT)-like permease
MNNRNGILLVIASMAGFTLEDMFIKQLSTTITTGQILITLGACGALIFATMAHLKGHSVFAPHVWTRATVARASTEAVAAIAFLTSLSLVPISTVAAVFQATPLAITMGAALFLGETVGWRRWTAILVGFMGVLLIIRPGYSGFDPAIIFVLIAVICVAARDLITRLVADNVPSTIISFQGFASVFFAGSILLLVRGDSLVSVTTLEASYLAGAVVFGVAGYYAIVAAMRIGDASAITPFRYTRLLFSLIVGMVVFSERPDAPTLIGASIIIGTGLYMFLREHRIAQADEIRV